MHENEFSPTKLAKPNDKNTIYERMDKDCATVRLFDDFRESNARYLAITFKGRFKQRTSFHLLIRKIPRFVETDNFRSVSNYKNYLPSNLKKEYFWIDRESDIDNFNAKELAGEIFNVMSRKQIYNHGDIEYFDHPCPLFAQDSTHRSGFGYNVFADYNRLYGETEKYAIIGAMIPPDIRKR